MTSEPRQETLLFEALELPRLPVVGGGLFPARRIYCVGRNYAAHAREMGFEVDREEPFFFAKPVDAIVLNDSAVPYPRMTGNFQHEVELVVAIGGAGRDISSATEARDLVFGYAVGLDMTRRDLQLAAREKGRPWDMGKGFDHSAPCSAITPRQMAGDIGNAELTLHVNGEKRQQSNVSLLVWSIEEIICWLSRYVDLFPGDLIYTGTPEGVSAVLPGDVLRGTIDGLEEIRVTIS